MRKVYTLLLFAFLLLIWQSGLFCSEMHANGPWGNNTPPSAVITYPHSNAYYQEGSDIVFRVYSTDVGGSFPAGTVSKVEFFVDDVKVHESATHVNHTYSFVLEDMQVGEYRLTARATDNLGATFTSAGVLLHVGTRPAIKRGMSAGKGKYLGNILAGSSVRADYLDLWNGVTAENAHKWGSVEGTRDVMRWTTGDNIYNFAKNNNLVFRYHAVAWGSQYPGWLNSIYPLSLDDPAVTATDEEMEAFVTIFKAEIDNYMAEMAARYPYMDQIDVLNENLYLTTYNGKEHAAGTPIFRAGMGGPGETGYDWAIWLFERARHYFPNSKLVMNDFELESNPAGINEMLDVIKVLRDRGLIDGFGTQAHTFNIYSMWNVASTLKQRIDLMASGGVPVYATEFDIASGSPASEANQLRSYQNVFPVFWEHPAVAGISLWGYVEGQTWISGTGLLNSDGTKRSAMIWLENYMANQPNVGFPFVGEEPDNQPTSNMLINGDFEMGTMGWDIQNHSGANGTITAIENTDMSGSYALQICASSTGTANWHVQVRQNAPFVAGKKYEISFKAKADAPRNIAVAVQQEGGSWTTHFQNDVSLTTEPQSFSFEFSPTVTDATAKLKFYTGTNSVCVYVDRVVFREMVGSSINDPAKQRIMQVFPNPFKDLLYITGDGSHVDVNYEIYNSTGQMVMRGVVAEGTGISTSSLLKGVYFVRATYGNSFEVHTVVKQ